MNAMLPTHFWLIRHGETEWNAGKRLQGWLDIPLSDVGRAQARQLAQRLKAADVPQFAAIYSSDLSRALETAQISAAHLGLPVTARETLRERNYGIFQGRDWAMLSDELSQQNISFSKPDQEIEGGETFAAFAQRISHAFESLAADHPGQNILVFAHGGVVDIAWRKAGGHDLHVKREGTILNTSINLFDISADGKWRMGAWNQVQHLDLPALDDIMPV